MIYLNIEILIGENFGMSKKIFKFKHSHQIDLLKKEFKESNPQEFSKYNEKWRRTFKVGDYGNFLQHYYSELIKDKVGVGFYHQLAGKEVKIHKDASCKCCINIKLSDDDSAVVIGEEKHYYDCALLNVSKYEHYVERCNIDRIIFRIMFVNTDFEIVKSYLL